MPRRTSGSGRSGAGYAANSYRTEGLVLRTYSLGEADRIIVLLTPQHGQVRAVAKGVRRTSSKFGATLEPFMLSRLQLVRGRSLDIVTQAESVRPYGSLIAGDYDAYTAASAMVETAERLTLAEVPGTAGPDDGPAGSQPPVTAPTQYRLLHGALAALARRAHAPRLLLDSYLLRALSTAGWAPTFTHCARCGDPGPHRSVNVTLGGTVCPDCRLPGSSTPSPETVQLLAALLAGDWAVADAAPDQARREGAGIVAGYLQFHLERHLKSMSVMDQHR